MGDKKQLSKPVDTTRFDYITEKTITDDNEYKKPIDLDKIDYGIMGRYSQRRKNISKEILSTFPELEFAMNMVISSMTAPTDVITDSVVITTDHSDILDTETKNMLLTNLKKTITSHYKLEENIFDYIKSAMVTDGAYCELIIPEAMVSKIMFTTSTANLESIDDLVKPKKLDYSVDFNLEGYDGADEDDVKDTMNYLTEYISGTDDLSTLMIKEIKESVNFEEDKDIEELSKAKKKKLLDSVFKEGITDEDPVKNLFALEEGLRKSVGRPFRMQIPVEAITPLSYKHDMKKHIGYVITLDENYMPITEANYKVISGESKEDDKENNLKEALVLTRSIIRKARDNAYKNVEKEPKIAELDDIASKIIDEKLKSMVVSNNYKDLIDSEMLNNVYLIMLNRALKKQKTKLLFVPKEYVWYLAVDYRDNGTGKTIIEDLGNISSLRSLLRHSRVFANLRSTIPLEKYDITIDDEIKDPDKIIAKARNFINRNRSMTMPNGLITSTDVTDWLHNSGLVLNINHADIPKFDIEKSVMDMDIKIPDEEIDEELRKATYMKLGINPEIVESALSNADFAGTINTQNLMYARDTIRKQRPINNGLKTYVRMISTHDYTLKNEQFDVLRDRIKVLAKKVPKGTMEHIKKEFQYTDEDLLEYFYEEFLRIIRVTLPKVENFEDNAMDKQFEYKYDNIDKVIELFLSSDAIVEDLSGAIGEKAEDIKPALKSAIMREWMRENNYMPELLNMFTQTEDGVESAPLENYRLFVENVKEVYLKFKKQTNKKRLKTDQKIEDLDNEELPDEDEETTEETNSTDETPKENDDGGVDDDSGTEDNEPIDEGSTDEEPMDDGTKEDDGDNEEPEDSLF